MVLWEEQGTDLAHGFYSSNCHRGGCVRTGSFWELLIGLIGLQGQPLRVEKALSLSDWDG